MIKALFDQQKNYLDHFFDHINYEKTNQILQKFLDCRGNIILTGVGKSGIIANKLTVTLLSIGTKSIFISPTEALHGDIGIVSKNDIFVCFSKSGETKEIIDLIPFVKKKGAMVISVVSHNESTLSKLSDFFIVLPFKKEICPFNLIPTTSTAIQLIFGDVLTIGLMKKKQFTLDEYAINHPSGNIGKKATLKVKDLMIKEKKMPICSEESKLIDVLYILSQKRCGALLIIDKKEKLLGIFTDGDLRRLIEKGDTLFLHKEIKELMTKNPKIISKEKFALEALEEMEKNSQKLVSVLPVVENEKVIGIIRMHDIIKEGLKN